MLPASVEFLAPVPVVVALVVIAIGLLLVRFVIGTAVTLLKIALLVGIGIAVYLAFVWLQGQF